MISLLLLLTFLASTMGIVAGYFVVADLARGDERRARARVEELRKGAGSAETALPLFKSVSEFDLGEFAQAAEPEWSSRSLLDWLRRDWLRPLRSRLGRSGLGVTVGHVLAASAVLGLGLGLAGWLAQGLVLGVPGVVIGAIAPLAYVEHKRRARQERFLAQLPSAFELMSRVIRSGQSVSQSFQAVSDSFDEPLSTAFARCREQQNLGLPPEVAFEELADQSGLLEMRIFVMAMMIQRQAGGNLSEVLERLASLLRERFRLRRQVRTLTAEGRLQASVLLVLPFVMFFAMRFVNRAYADEVLEHRSLLAATAVVMTVGAVWIRKIVSFDV